MGVFAYTAIDRTGRRTTGTVPADNKAAAMDHVLGQGLSPVSIEESRTAGAATIASNRPPPTRVPQSAVESFTRELANLLAAGLPLSRALHLLRREVSSPGAKHVWSGGHDDVVGGVSLAGGMAKGPKVFSSVYVAVVRGGAAGGGLWGGLVERAMLNTPLLGKVAARFALVRFARMLGTLVGAGVPLVASLRTAKEALGNQTLADAVSHAIDEVQRGTALSRSLAGNTLLFPASVIEMIAIAEETGRLDKELVRLSIAYEGELDRNLRMLVALAEPLMRFMMA